MEGNRNSKVAYDVGRRSVRVVANKWLSNLEFMTGAIFGDIEGSVYEFCNTDNYDFEYYDKRSFITDDSVCTLAVAETLLHGTPIEETLVSFCRRMPNAGYGGRFAIWLGLKHREPYNSCGNGSAMRVSAVGWAASSEAECKEMAEYVTAVTHNHPEGLKGAEAVALAVFRLRQAHGEDEKRRVIDDIMRKYYPGVTDAGVERMRGVFDETCQTAVPMAMYLLRQAKSFEDATRLTISFGGDCDTTGAIVCGMAEAFYGMSPAERKFALGKIPFADWRSLVEDFETKFGNKIV